MLLSACGFEHGVAGKLADGAPTDDMPRIIDATRCARRTVLRPDGYDDRRLLPVRGQRERCLAEHVERDDVERQLRDRSRRHGDAVRFDERGRSRRSAALDVAALTIEAWINPSTADRRRRMGILDMNGQWGFFLHETGQLRCTASVTITVGANIVANEWTHVACTYDGATATIYVNGVAATPTGTGGALSTAGNTGLSLAADNPAGSGSRLIGMIDELRLMSRARTAAEICVDAGACAPPVQ